MLIVLCSVVVVSTLTAVVIAGLLLTGRASATTQIRILPKRRTRRTRTASSQPARNNLGEPTVDLTGGLSVGVGNGLTIDPSDGSLGMRIAPGISIDFDGK